jgi:hypothetical protein
VTGDCRRGEMDFTICAFHQIVLGDQIKHVALIDKKCKNLKEIDHLKDLDVDEKITFK